MSRRCRLSSLGVNMSRTGQWRNSPYTEAFRALIHKSLCNNRVIGSHHLVGVVQQDALLAFTQVLDEHALLLPVGTGLRCVGSRAKLAARLQIQIHVLLPCEAVFERLEHFGHTADDRPSFVDATQVGADVEMATDTVAPVEAGVERGMAHIAATGAAGGAGEDPIRQLAESRSRRSRRARIRA